MTAVQPAIIRKLQSWKSKLLDLSRANRLLYYKPTRSSSTPITFPQPDKLFHQLVVQGKVLTFPLTEEKELFDLEDRDSNEEAKPALPRRYRNNEVGSPLTDLQFSRVLYNLRSRARSALEEQGVNVLFLALGMLRWYESAGGEPIQSPILLVPVSLGREALRKPYTLTMLEDDIVLNPTLAHKLETDFAVQLPEPGDALEEDGPAAYLDQIRKAIAGQPAWEVLSEAHLGIFSFQKLSLYKDLEIHQDLFSAHSLIASLAGGAPLPTPSAVLMADQLDDLIPPVAVFQVVDADSSQQEAIEAAKRGASFVLQGPPGTGKSQTITNIIGEFLAGGKRILFVSEKMAALEVVQRRLHEAGLGGFCLQLHSHKRDKREVVDELVQALEAPTLQMKPAYQDALSELESARKVLNAYVRALHQPRFNLQLTVFRAHGEMARLHGAPEVTFSIGDITKVDGNELSKRIGVLDQFAHLPEVVNNYEHHPWRGSTVKDLSFGLRDRLIEALDQLIRLLVQYEAALSELAAASKLHAPANLAETEGLLKVLQVYQPKLFALDLTALRQHFAQNYKRFYRVILSSYRADIRTLQGLLWTTRKLVYQQVCKDIEFALRVKAELAGDPVGGADSDITQERVRQATSMAEKITAALRTLAEAFGGGPPSVGEARLSQARFSNLQAWLIARRERIEDLKDWASFLRLRDDAQAHEIGSFVEMALAQKLPAAQWLNAYLYAFHKQFVDAATLSDEALSRFDSRAHDTLIRRFRELDRQNLKIARARIRAMLSEHRPKSSWIEAATAEQAILRHEAAKKRRLKPLRRLLSEIPRLVTELKPCLLMSPLTVSMLLNPKLFKFDLVIFDEASQIAPEEAVGAILRGTQAIIVGDRQQLPPTRFFAALGEDDGDEDEIYEDNVYDSVLEECEGAGLPSKMLLWHYRSRHESLIAFSNYHFYHNRLYTFPSPQREGQGIGLEFVHVPEGIYRRGKSLRRNDVEARRVVDLIFDHFRNCPERTLGVIAFSMAQQEAIRMEWERRRRERPDFERHFDENVQEPFFIKNLETVQGDERDVIVFSVGYGRDEAGKLTLNFGPLNRAGGERRLNVAVSRARYQVKLVSSILPEDIDLARTNSQGARLLRQYMEIARDGLKALYADTSVTAEAEFESPFEQSVHDALTSKGLTVHLQVGVSGYRIDLAVVDPQAPGSYLLGIECDGATYHSGRTARDRDRLRQQVLEGLGWKIYRIWSRDWLTNRQREMLKLTEALADAWRSKHSKSGSQQDPPPAMFEAVTPEAFLAKASKPRSASSLPKSVRPYQTASVTVYRRPSGGLANVDAWELADHIVHIVEVEGPVHTDLVVERMAEAWGVGRLGNRIRESLTSAITMARLKGGIEQRGDFLWPAAMNLPPVRVPVEGTEPRNIEYIAPEEIAEAVYICVREALSLSQGDLIREAAQLLGINRVSSKVEVAVAQGIALLAGARRILIQDDVVRLPQ